jgi:AcrR family transcriptional regulator
VATLYRHFGSREDLLRALVTEIVEDALAQIDQAIQPYPDDPRAAFQALISVGLRVFEQYRSLFTLVHDPRLTKLVDPAQGEALRAQVLGQAAGVIERGIQAGIFWDGLDPELIAATIFGSLAGVFGNLGKRSPLAELEQQLTHLLWRMVAKEGNTAFLSGSPTGEPGTAGT